MPMGTASNRASLPLWISARGTICGTVMMMPIQSSFSNDSRVDSQP